MSWMDTTVCPICGADGFEPDCDEVDVGVGVIEGNLRGLCRNCGEVCEKGDLKPGFVAEFPPTSVDREATPAEVADLGGDVDVRCPVCLDRVGGCPHCVEQLVEGVLAVVDEASRKVLDGEVGTYHPCVHGYPADGECPKCFDLLKGAIDDVVVAAVKRES